MLNEKAWDSMDDDPFRGKDVWKDRVWALASGPDTIELRYTVDEGAHPDEASVKLVEVSHDSSLLKIYPRSGHRDFGLNFTPKYDRIAHAAPR
jgi:hypothetical protein